MTELWAFGTSPAPMGLGRTWKQVLGMTPREHQALRRVWERQHKIDAAMWYQLRADIHNSSENLNRTDKRRWTAQDFGAEATPEDRRPKPMTREETRIKMLATIGPGENGSVLGKLKGQALPPEIQAKITAAKSRAKPRRPIPKNARGEPVPPR